MKRAASEGRKIDLASLRKSLAEQRGRRFWRSLEELAETEEFQEFLHHEFPSQTFQDLDPLGRRHFLKLMGASLALAGIGACTRQPDEKILPYVQAPEQVVPGKPLFFATAFTIGGYASGVLVESHLGRPTKIEGNPQHPASLGATNAWAQASILTLYDPDRSQVVDHRGRISTWSNFVRALSGEMNRQKLRQGKGLRILTETVTSPTLAFQIQQLLSQYPQSKWHQYDPASQDSAKEGTKIALGEYLNIRYQLDRADVVLSLDADFLCDGPAALRYAREFVRRRQVDEKRTAMNRLYVVESTPSNTGALADHRLSLKASQIEGLTRSLAKRLGMPIDEAWHGVDEDWIAAVARDLDSHRGRSLVLPGESQPPAVHALAHALNHTLGNINETVIYADPVEAHPVNHMESLKELVSEMKEGNVELLVVMGGNPAFTAPADLEFAKHLSHVPFRVHLSLYHDETSELCHWHIPETHYLESWSDARAFDGTATIIQPLIAPLYDGKSAHQLVSALLGQPDRSSHDIVSSYWQGQRAGENFKTFWEKALHDGLVPGTSLSAKRVSLNLGRIKEISTPGPVTTGRGNDELEIVFRLDPKIQDGRFANNAWLQELPSPLTKLTWDNAVLVSPRTAERLGWKQEESVELHYGEHSVEAPVWIMPGQPDDSLAVHLGYGRTRAGQVGTGVGFNGYLIRTSDAPWFAPGLNVRKTGRRYSLTSTQHHQYMEGRHLVRIGTAREYEKNPHFAQQTGHAPAAELSLYPDHENEGYAWGMVINLNSCIGCNACVIACQAENNIPVVGKTEVRRGREMHWLRVDRYYKDDLDDPETYFQPVPCMHCEKAPCEPVCPVGATVHSREGLNEMVYNRCVGTRYCSNNCPYKVRRFNFFSYADFETPSLKLLNNPDVSVRTRGVMEKCTYCVQRINAARIQSEKEGRPIQEGEVQTACQQVCPTEAIVFGDIHNRDSRVARMKAHALNYGLLEDLNTRPRTTYWARLKNPNPEIENEQG